jgi:ribosomal protein S7
MRSDFLGECVRWPSLAEAANRAQYLLPRMGPAPLRRAICRPAELYRGEIDATLADRMIADARGEQDELPLIQHALMRLWDLAEVVNGCRHLDVAIYEKHGPLTRILDEHADEIAHTAEPGRDELPLTSGIFRALSDLNAAGQPIRRRQTLKELSAVTAAPEDRVRAVVNAFRADGVSFLKPYGREPLDDREPIDIAHEALMRCWKRLSDPGTGWLWDEFRQGLAWEALTAQADLFLKNSRNVLSPPTTEDRGQWLNSRTEAWAARYGGGWDKVSRLLNASRASAYRLRLKIRLLGLSLGVLALLTLGGILWGVRVYDNATKALDDLYAEQAKVIWSEIGSSSNSDLLTPRQRNALWQIANSEPKVRAKFVGLLSEDPDLALRFAGNAGVISRAIGLDWPQTTEQVQAALEPVLDAIGKTTDSDALAALAQAVKALAPRLTAEQAQAALGRVLDALGKTTDSDALAALAQAVEALAPALTAGQAQAGFGRVLDALGKTTDSDALAALARAVKALAPRLTAEQAHATLGRVLDAIGKTTASNQLGALAQALQALAPKLTAEQAQAALGRVLDAFERRTPLFGLRTLAPAVEALAPRLTAEQAQAALQRVLPENPTSPYVIEAAAQAVLVLAPSLTAEPAWAALGRFLDFFEKWPYRSRLPGVVQVVPGLARRLTAEQAQVALNRALEAVEKPADLGPVDLLASAIPVLASRLTTEQAQAALGHVLDAIGKTTASNQLGALAQALQAFAPKLTAEQAKQAIARAQSALGWSASSDEAQQRGRALAALLEHIPDPKSASRVLTDALKFPIAAGKPSDELLTALQKYLPSSPGPIVSLVANLDWLKQNVQSTDLTGRAICPLPPREALHCPDQAKPKRDF